MKELNIAGFVPFSTVDWPGKLAAVAFLQGCPWRCPYCHNSGILDPRVNGPVTWQEVMATMRKRAGLLDGLVFSGGEALMQASSGALGRCLTQVQNEGFKTGLHAGGAYPKMLEELLNKGLIDWVGLDVKAMPDDYPLATGRAGGANAERSLRALACHPEVDHEVRLTLWPGLAPSGDLLSYAVTVARWVLENGARKFALQRYRVPPTGGDYLPEVGWSDEEAAALLADIGFEQVTLR